MNIQTMVQIRKFRKYIRRKAKKYIKKRATARKLTQRTVYRFNMSQQPAYLVTAGTSGGAGNTITGYNVGSVSSSLIGTPIAAKSGFASFWDFGQSFQFKLQDLKNYAAYTALYDQWRINGITLTIESLSTVAPIGNLALMPTIYAVTDYDDANIPTLVSNICGRQGFKMFKVGHKQKTSFTFRLKPKVANLVYTDSVLGVGYGSTTGWYDCNSPEIPYYGLKLFYTDVFAPDSRTVNQAFKIDVKYNLAFRGPLIET